MPFLRKRALLLAVGIVLVLGGVKFYKRSPFPVISPLADDGKEAEPEPNLLAFFSNKKDPDDLKRQIQNLIDGNLVNYSVYIKDLKSDFTVAINESVIYEAASVNKIPIIAALYYYAEKGDIDLDKKITLQPEDIQDYGTGSIRYDTPGSVYSLKTLAKLMIQQSDNTASYVLSNQVLTLDQIQSLINSWGATQTDMINNKTSNKDTELFMEKIYKGQVASAANTQEMLAFFKNTDFEDRIPALLPSEATVYHKIGNADGSIHDVGIVEHGSTTYYLGVFTRDIVDEAGTVKLLSKISRLVYNYLKK